MVDGDLLALLASNLDTKDKWAADPEYVKYLEELTAMNIDKVRGEPDRIAQEQRRILQETQELAFRSYTGFIQTADCSREIFSEFLNVNQHVGDTLAKLPALADQSNAFLTAAPEISQRRKLNLLTLQHHTKLLEILEIPQLMETLVRNGHYEEALDLEVHVMRLVRKYGDIGVLVAVAAEVEHSTELILMQLLQLLHTDINLASCLRIVGHIRRLARFSDSELRLKFLHTRGAWLSSNMQAGDSADAYSYINKCLDVFRVGILDIVSQYRAVFADDLDTAPTADGSGGFLFGWATTTMGQLVTLLQEQLPRVTEGALLHSLIDQCGYLSQSLGRAGLDCRSLLAPVLQNAVKDLFAKRVVSATQTFIKEMKQDPRGICTPAISVSGVRGPLVIADYTHATLLVNAYIDAYNNLRHCAPLSIANELCQLIESELTRASLALATHYHDYVDLHADDEPKFRDQFVKLCEAWALDGVPFVARCFGTIFPAPQSSTVNAKTAVAPLDGIVKERDAYAPIVFHTSHSRTPSITTTADTPPPPTTPSPTPSADSTHNASTSIPMAASFPSLTSLTDAAPSNNNTISQPTSDVETSREASVLKGQRTEPDMANVQSVDYSPHQSAAPISSTIAAPELDGNVPISANDLNSSESSNEPQSLP